MEKLLKKPRKSRFCCCSLSSSSGDESIITIDRDSIQPFEPLSQRKFPITKYSADKVYIIPASPKYFIISIKQIGINSKLCSVSQLIQPKAKYNLSKKSSNSVLIKEEDIIKSSEISTDNFLSDKVIRKLCKLLNSRKNPKNCLVNANRVCNFALYMARYCHVMSVESEIVITEMVQNNPMIQNQGFKINLIDGDITQLEKSTEVDLAILNFVEKNCEDQEVTNEFIDNIVNTLRSCLKISNNVVIILPFDLDPSKFCEKISDLHVEPCIEFIVYTDQNPNKFIIALIGKVARVDSNEIILNLCGRLKIPGKQQNSVKKIIDKLGLVETLSILREVEKEKFSKAQNFFERAKQLGLNFPEIKILFLNPESSLIVSHLQALKEFFFIYPTEDVTTLYAEGLKFLGQIKILEYIEEFQNNEFNLNSLLQLVDG